MRRSSVLLLLAFTLLVCSGVVTADQNAVVVSNSNRAIRSLRTDRSDDGKKRRLVETEATTEELTPEEEDRKGGRGGGGRGGGRGRNTFRSRTTRSRGTSTRVRGSFFSRIRAWFAKMTYKRWFKKGRTPEQVNRGLNPSKESDHKLSTGYQSYWRTRTIGYVPYYNPNGDHSKNE